MLQQASTALPAAAISPPCLGTYNPLHHWNLNFLPFWPPIYPRPVGKQTIYPPPPDSASTPKVGKTTVLGKVLCHPVAPMGHGYRAR